MSEEQNSQTEEQENAAPAAEGGLEEGAGEVSSLSDPGDIIING